MLMLLVSLLAAGTLALLLIARTGSLWAPGALGGWLLAGVMGLSGWWTGRKALSGDNRTFLKYVMGGILVRMMLMGVLAGLVIGLRWLDPNGFVLGLLTGITLFMGIEIGGLERSARRMRNRAETIPGATDRG